MKDAALEDHEAIVSCLPTYDGDGYGYGGGVVVSIGPYAIPFGCQNHELADEIVARWNAQRGRRVRPEIVF